jgi:nitroreductase
MDRRNILIGGGALVLAGGATAFASMRQMGSMDAYNASVAATRARLSEAPEMRDLIRYATLAANSHNTQPWRFKVADGSIQMLPDFTRRIPVVDGDDHHIFASLGCAAENLAIAASARGKAGALTFQSTDGGSILFKPGSGTTSAATVLDAIPLRQSTRTDYDGRPVSAADLTLLAEAAKLADVDVVFVTERAQINRVRDLIIEANTAQMADPAFARELKSWIRFNPSEAMASGDGLFAPLSGNPIMPSWAAPTLFSWFFQTESENAKYLKQIDSSAGLAIFVSAAANPENWILAGRASQRFALQATALGLKHAFVNQPVEVAKFRPDLAALIGLPGRRPDLVMRFGYAAALPFSARRPVEAVLA